MSCPKPNPDAPHQNTPESLARGNALLAEAKQLRDLGVSLQRSIEELDRRKDEAFELSRSKQYEAEKLLLGRRDYGRY